MTRWASSRQPGIPEEVKGTITQGPYIDTYDETVFSNKEAWLQHSGHTNVRIARRVIEILLNIFHRGLLPFWCISLIWSNLKLVYFHLVQISLNSFSSCSRPNCICILYTKLTSSMHLSPNPFADFSSTSGTKIYLFKWYLSLMLGDSIFWLRVPWYDLGATRYLGPIKL